MKINNVNSILLFSLSLLLFIFIVPNQVSAQIIPPPLPTTSTLLGGPVADKAGCVGGTNCGLGGLISNILTYVFGVAGILAFIWGFIGVFQYITAGGNKESLSKAKARITWAFVGLIFLIISYSLSLYVREVLQFADPTSIPTISSPP